MISQTELTDCPEKDPLSDAIRTEAIAREAFNTANRLYKSACRSNDASAIISAEEAMLAAKRTHHASLKVYKGCLGAYFAAQAKHQTRRPT
jgi:hypothetical protein